jgi:hypothetical protein
MNPQLNALSIFMQSYAPPHTGSKMISSSESMFLPGIQHNLENIRPLLTLSSIHITLSPHHVAMEGMNHGVEKHQQMNEKIIRFIRMYMEEEIS